MFTWCFSNFDNYDCQHFIVVSTVDILNRFVRGRRQDCAYRVESERSILSARRYALARYLPSLCVCPSSVRLSVTSRSSTKMAKPIGG